MRITTLDARLAAELPGILMWALEGLDRLMRNGRFTVPGASADAANLMMDLASPMSAFVRDRCVRNVNAIVDDASTRVEGLGRGERPHGWSKVHLRSGPTRGGARVEDHQPSNRRRSGTPLRPDRPPVSELRWSLSCITCGCQRIRRSMATPTGDGHPASAHIQADLAPLTGCGPLSDGATKPQVSGGCTGCRQECI